MDKPMTYARFERVIQDLGFQKTVVPQSDVVFQQGNSKRLVVVRLLNANEELPWHVVASARRHLDEWGVLGATAFDEMLHDAAASMRDRLDSKIVSANLNSVLSAGSAPGLCLPLQNHNFPFMRQARIQALSPISCFRISNHLK